MSSLNSDSTSIERESKNIRVSKGNFEGHILSEKQERDQAYHLRHQVFAEKLKWVPRNDKELDIDEYDPEALILGVFEDGHIVGTLRVISSEHLFMIEKDFKYLLKSRSIIKSQDTVEISRLGVDPNIKSKQEKKKIVFLLYYLLYLWIVENHVRYLYLVSTHKLIESLKTDRHFPIETFGESGLTHDNTSYQAAFIDMEKLMSLKNRIKFFLQLLFI